MALLVVSTCGLSACSTSSTSPGSGQLPAGSPCPPREHGALCIKLFHNGSTLTDAIAYLSSTDTALAGKTWRLLLSEYGCDPGVSTTSACSPTASYPGPTRHGLPPLVGSCRDAADGSTTTTPPGCHDTLAEELATHGDWSGFFDGTGTPPRYASPTWLCVSEELRSGRAWRAPDGALSPHPVRACATI